MIALALSAQAASVGSPDAVGTRASARGSFPGGEHVVALTPERLFLLAEQLVTGGHPADAIPLLKALSTNPNADYRAEARARLARVYAASGDDRAAAAWFQKLLDEKPDAAAVRVELADVLMRLGDAGGASRQLRRAAAARGLPEAVARALGNVGASLRSDAPVQISAQVGIAPDTNIDRATQAQTVDIYGLPFTLDPNARAKSGVGLTSGGDLTLQHRISPNEKLVATVSTTANLYRDTAFDDIAVTGDLGPEFAHKSAFFRPSLVVGSRWYGLRPLYRLYGLSFTARTSASRTSQITLSLTGLHFDYGSRADLSGPFYAASIAYERALTPRTLVRLDLGVSRVAAHDPAQASVAPSASATLSRDVGRIIAYGRVGVGRTFGDAPFAGVGVARDDRLYDGEIGLIYKRISLWGLSPLVKARHIENHSPVAFYDYRQTRFEFALTKTF